MKYSVVCWVLFVTHFYQLHGIFCYDSFTIHTHCVSLKYGSFTESANNESSNGIGVSKVGYSTQFMARLWDLKVGYSAQSMTGLWPVGLEGCLLYPIYD
ncbi:hypothetical protein RIF29_26553 [Crotalaria pallida]|uniref:Secreted protein n=1 Tax=Crotalaria pallida TaxID=3830 RepID=A0AAN9EMU0_CROPI